MSGARGAYVFERRVAGNVAESNYRNCETVLGPLPPHSASVCRNRGAVSASSEATSSGEKICADHLSLFRTRHEVPVVTSEPTSTAGCLR